MRIRVPEGSALFVFGSALHSGRPNDLDVLIVYDAAVCDPLIAYSYHKGLINDLTVAFGLPVHATLLTYSEAQSTEFVARTNAVSFANVQRGLTLRCTPTHYGWLRQPSRAGELIR